MLMYHICESKKHNHSIIYQKQMLSILVHLHKSTYLPQSTCICETHHTGPIIPQGKP